jgi:hypothetical protein
MKKMAFLKETHDPIFDALELNKDGHISNSLDEFKVYFQIIAPDISEDEVTHSFNVIDSNKDGEISCEELLSTFCMVLKKQNYYYIIIKKIIFSVWAFQYLYIQWKYLNSYAVRVGTPLCYMHALRK